jgi:hypothetical protein
MDIHFDITVVKAKNILIGLVLFELGLIAIYLTGHVIGHPTKFFDLDGEANLPAWFSSMQFLLIGQVFYLKSLQPNPKNLPSYFFLILISAGFIFLSVDEAAQVHETLSGILKRSTSMPRFKDGNGMWILPYVLIGSFVFYKVYREVLVMWNHFRKETMVMASGMIMIAFGAVFLEIISYQFLRTSSRENQFVIEVAFEELFEMAGASLVLYGALLFLIKGTKIVK